MTEFTRDTEKFAEARATIRCIGEIRERKAVLDKLPLAKRKTVAWKAEYAELDEELALIGNVPTVLTEAKFREMVMGCIKAKYDPAVERVANFKAEIASASPRMFLEAFEWADGVVQAAQIVVVLGELYNALEHARTEDFATIIQATKDKIMREAAYFLKSGGVSSSSVMSNATTGLRCAGDAQVVSALNRIVPLNVDCLVLLEDSEAKKDGQD